MRATRADALCHTTGVTSGFAAARSASASVEPPGRRVALGPEQVQARRAIASARTYPPGPPSLKGRGELTARRRLSLPFREGGRGGRFLQLLDRLIDRGHGLFGFVAVHERVVERARRGRAPAPRRGRHAAGTAAAPRALVRSTRAARKYASANWSSRSSIAQAKRYNSVGFVEAPRPPTTASRAGSTRPPPSGGSAPSAATATRPPLGGAGAAGCVCASDCVTIGSASIARTFRFEQAQRSGIRFSSRSTFAFDITHVDSCGYFASSAS